MEQLSLESVPFTTTSGSCKSTEADKDKVIARLAHDLEELKTKVHIIETNKVAEALGLTPEEVIREEIVKPKSGLLGPEGWRPLLEAEILDAQSKFDTAAACARYLHICYKTYKKWSKKYGIHKTNKFGKDRKKTYNDPEKGKYPVSRILLGEFPHLPQWYVKQKLLRSGKKIARCEHPQCACLGGFRGKRPLDEKMPLILNCLDGDPTNYKEENVKIYCYNCTFMYGRGYIKRGIIKRGIVSFNNPERLQGSDVNLPAAMNDIYAPVPKSN